MDTLSLTYPLDGVPPELRDKPLSVAIGHFDGVHRGHQDVIRRAVEAARRNDMRSAVMTFHPHPKEVLGQGDRYFSCLTPLEDKIRLFAELGVDVTIVVKFDTTFAAVLPERFIDEVLRTLRAKQVVVGFDFTFGYRGEGNARLMLEAGGPDIAVEIAEPLCENGEKVSSTRIRQALDEGDVERAELLLGRPYEVSGIVVHGDKRGRTIGFPTANVEPSAPYVVPRLGVYAVSAAVNGRTFYGVLNHGRKPTFNDGMQTTLEAHLFDFNGDIYGERINLRFHSFIRPERKFAAVSELIEQIGNDAMTAKKRFNLL